MLDRHGMEAATGAASLGMLADDALIAVVRYQNATPLSERDRSALERALDVLEAIRELGTRQVVVTSRLRGMAPVGVLDETFQAITDARDDAGEDLAAGIARLQEAVRAVLSGDADSSAAERLKQFFDRLGAITLARSEEVARPGREQRGKWIREALGS